MTAAAIFGALMVSAILAHHGSPWLAFVLGAMALVVQVVNRLLSPDGDDESEA